MEQKKDIYLLGVSYRTASAAVREALSFTTTEVASFLSCAARALPDTEALILSTCNRTEFYLATDSGPLCVHRWLELLKEYRPGAPILRNECKRYEASHQDAVKHLFRVAAGLDSSILGDVNIVGQIKEALRVAGDSSTLGRYLSRAFGQALSVGRRSRRETDISAGSASVGSAIASMIESMNTKTTPPRVLIVGAGTIARSLGRHLRKRSDTELHFINRTAEKGSEIAVYCAGQAHLWEELIEQAIAADMIVAATSSPDPIISSKMLREIRQRRLDSGPLYIDAGMPRNIEATAQVIVHDIDRIRDYRDEALKKRELSVPHVEKIITEELYDWQQWSSRQGLERIIKSLYLDAAAMSAELTKTLTSRQRIDSAEAHTMVQRSLKQVLHGHVTKLRDLEFH